MGHCQPVIGRAAKVESAVLHVVFNPVAGRGRARAALDELVRQLEAAGAEHALHVTTGPGHAVELAAATPAGATVVAVGGDGTVHEVVTGLVRAEGGRAVTSRCLGVVPVGSGDDFAHALGLRRGDVPAAVRTLLAGARERVDLGMVNGAPFANAFSTGFDADVASRLDDAPGFLKGLAAYLYALVISLGSARSVPAKVVLDGIDAGVGTALLVAAQNGPRTGGSFRYAPDAVPDDGLLDVVVARDLGLLGTLSVLPRVMMGTHLTHPKIELRRARRVEIEWVQPRRAHADGESAGRSERFVVELLPGALTVIR